MGVLRVISDKTSEVIKEYSMPVLIGVITVSGSIINFAIQSPATIIFTLNGAVLVSFFWQRIIHKKHKLYIDTIERMHSNTMETVDLYHDHVVKAKKENAALLKEKENDYALIKELYEYIDTLRTEIKEMKKRSS